MSKDNDAVDALAQFLTKEMMVKQGYIPPTCTMPEPLVGILVWHEINAGRNPCWGCNSDREECKGQPRRTRK